MTTLDEQLWMQSQMDKTMQMNAGVAPSSVSTASTNTGGMPLGMGSGSVSIPPAPTQERTASDLFALQEKKRLAALEAQKRSALATLGQERGLVEPQYQRAVSGAAGQSATGARNLAEYMAQRGLTNSGASVQGEISRQGALQNVVGGLEQERVNWLSDIARRETGAKSAYDQGALEASLDREASSLQARLAEQERARTESIGTVGQYGQDYAAEINAIQAEMARGDNSRAYLLPYLKIARQEKVAGIAKSQADQEQEEWDRWLDMQRLRKTGSGSGSSGKDPNELTEDEAFGADYNKVASGGVTKDMLLANRQSLIGQYGLTKYNQLLALFESQGEDEYGLPLKPAVQYPSPLRYDMIQQGFGTNWKGRWY